MVSKCSKPSLFTHSHLDNPECRGRKAQSDQNSLQSIADGHITVATENRCFNHLQGVFPTGQSDNDWL